AAGWGTVPHTTCCGLICRGQMGTGPKRDGSWGLSPFRVEDRMKALRGRILAMVAIAAALAATASGRQAPLFTDAFPPEEFAARRAKVLTAIGDGVAV